MSELLFNLFEQNPGSRIKVLFTDGQSETYDYHDEDFRNMYFNSPNLFKVHNPNIDNYVYINSDHIMSIEVVN
ncbi:hypothetical protein [Lactococcus garvieae]|uniref:Uncharacterized protein n=1 Tax=Lactococcus garvieae DCC43 TaxID=1231377 RepID=K2NUY2_9LACT|nr:hypothetical protein [Lactococcus garvieae]EKF51338.1 hypothetical protein C426_1292 [Lactococcus garvieae DCC43]